MGSRGRSAKGAGEALVRVRMFAASVATNPLAHMRWTPPQLAFLSDPSRYSLLALGQQLGGKTTAGLADTIWRCLGEHPYQVLPPRPRGRPYQAWVVCFSHQQSLQIQAKLWALLPKDRLDKRTVYQGLSRGFRGKHPAIVFDNGATILIKTTHQGAAALASGTVDHIQVDEPTTGACWTEITGRVRRTAGTIRATLTPINSDVEYLEKAVADGIVAYHRYDLTEDNATPVGAAGPLRREDGTPINEAFIAQLRKEIPADIAPTVLDGHWERRGFGRYFDLFVKDPDAPGAHVTTRQPDGMVEVLLGIDHGHRPGKQIATLVFVQYVDSRADTYAYRRALVWVVDEYTDTTGRATPADDARGILDMLNRRGLKWTDVDYVLGDRVHMQGTAAQKSNKDLAAQLSKLLGIRQEDMRPQVRTVQKTRGNFGGYVESGARWIFQAMAAPGGFSVHPRCTRTIDALNKWTGPGPDSEDKDPIDALRYALETVIYRKGIRPGVAEVIVG